MQLQQQSHDFSLLAIETTIEKQKDNKSPEKSSKIFPARETRSSRWTFLTRNRVSRVNNVLQNYLERTKSWHFISLWRTFLWCPIFGIFPNLNFGSVNFWGLKREKFSGYFESLDKYYEAFWITQSVHLIFPNHVDLLWSRTNIKEPWNNK